MECKYVNHAKEKESKKNNMVGTILAKDPIKEISDRYTKGIIILVRSFHGKDLHRVHGHEHKVQGRLPVVQCNSFQSLPF